VREKKTLVWGGLKADEFEGKKERGDSVGGAIGGRRVTRGVPRTQKNKRTRDSRTDKSKTNQRGRGQVSVWEMGGGRLQRGGGEAVGGEICLEGENVAEKPGGQKGAE